ncbi:hypothetical protein MASR1M48_17310 [Lactococcus petauri]
MNFAPVFMFAAPSDYNVHQGLLDTAIAIKNHVQCCCSEDVLLQFDMVDDIDFVLNQLGVSPVEKALNSQKLEDFKKYEARYVRALRSAYRGGSKDYIEELHNAIKKVDPSIPSTIEDFVKNSANILDQMSKETAKEVYPVLNASIEDMYTVSRKSMTNDLFDRGRITSRKEISSFGTRDQQVVDMMTRNSKVFVQSGIENMSENFGFRAKDIIAEGLKEGWSRKTIASKLSNASEMTVENEQYWNVVGNNYANRSRNWANLEVFDEVGFDEYEVLAVMDERTSPICVQMNGKRFSIRKQIDIMERASKSDDLEEYTSKLPWLTSRKEEDGNISIGVQRKSGFKPVLTGGEFVSSKDKLQGMGFALPPYHGLCRTTIIEV